MKNLLVKFTPIKGAEKKDIFRGPYLNSCFWEKKKPYRTKYWFQNRGTARIWYVARSELLLYLRIFCGVATRASIVRTKSKCLIQGKGCPYTIDKNYDNSNCLDFMNWIDAFKFVSYSSSSKLFFYDNFAFISIVCKLFFEIPPAIYKWIEVGTKLDCISKST